MKCTSRSQEVNNLKEDSDLKIWKTDSSGVRKDTDIVANLSTELDVHNALWRRGVACEIAQAMSFEVHELIINFFFHELKKDLMKGFAPISFNQLAAADRELHVRLAELTRSGLHPGLAGQLPLDEHEHVKTLLAGPEIRWLSMPTPRRRLHHIRRQWRSSTVVKTPIPRRSRMKKKSKRQKQIWRG